MLRKKGLCLLLGVMLLIPFAVPALAATATNYVTYYVVTADKGPLNVRSSPIAPAKNVIGSLQYGASVTVVSFTQDRSWAIIIYGKQNAYVMTRYLNLNPPASQIQPVEKYEETVEDLNRIFRSMRPADYDVVARPSRASGWVNLRWAPSLEAEVVQRCYDGYALHVIQSSSTWALVEDLETGNVGFISTKYLVTVSYMEPVYHDPYKMTDPEDEDEDEEGEEMFKFGEEGEEGYDEEGPGNTELKYQ